LVAWRPHTAGNPPWRHDTRKVSEAIGARLAKNLEEISGAAFVEASSRLQLTGGMYGNESTPGALTPKPQVGEAPRGAKETTQTTARAPSATRYFVRLDDLPDAVTPAGLLDAAHVAGCQPVGCEIADDLDEGRRMAAIFFADELAPTRVAQALRRHGWHAKPFIASEEKIAPRAACETVDLVTNINGPGLSSVSAVTESAEYRLLIGPVPKRVDLERVISRVRQFYPRARFLERLWEDRGSVKYFVEFNWPNDVAIPTCAEDLVCGHERLAVEFVTAGGGGT